MAGKSLSAKEICAHLAGAGHEPLTEMALSNFVKEGLPRASRGKYDLEACSFWYLGRLRTANQRRTAEVEGEDGKALPSLDHAERRLKIAKAESEEMTLAERRGELMPVHMHESMLVHLVAVTKQRMRNIAPRLAPKLEGCISIEIKALLNASIDAALTELSRKGASIAKDHATEPRPAKSRTAARRGHARKPRPRK